VSRGSDGAPAEHDATPVASPSVAGSVTVVVLVVFRSMVALAFVVTGPLSTAGGVTVSIRVAVAVSGGESVSVAVMTTL
jgi:hypothetical protein